MRWAEYLRQNRDKVKPCSCDAGYGPHSKTCDYMVSLDEVWYSWVEKYKDTTACVFKRLDEYDDYED